MVKESNASPNTEIDQALKEFEAKSNQRQVTPENNIKDVITPQTPQAPTHEVEGVSFDTDTEVQSYNAIKFYKETVEPKIVKAVIKYSGRTVKNQRQAEWLLLGFVVVSIGISIYLFFGFGHKQQQINPAIVQQMQQEFK